MSTGGVLKRQAIFGRNSSKWIGNFSQGYLYLLKASLCMAAFSKQTGRTSWPEVRWISTSPQVLSPFHTELSILASDLDGLRTVLPGNVLGHLVALIEEIHKSAKLIRDLASRSQVHNARAPIVSSHLGVLLPCLSKSLRDITQRYEDRTISRERRWRKMYHDMVEESGGLGPPQRFMVYNEFLLQLIYLLVRDTKYDPGQLEVLRARILDLRQRRGIALAPSQPTPITTNVVVTQGQVGGQGAIVVVPLPSERVHWCEQVFSLPLSSRTDLGQPERSRALGPFVPEGGDPQHPVVARRIFLRRSFDEGRMCVMFVENAAANGASWVMVRLLLPGGVGQIFSYRGHHELCVRRQGNALVLMRWSRSSRCAKDWAVLCFATWEGE